MGQFFEGERSMVCVHREAATMKIRHKLLAGYLLAAVLITLSGLFGLYGTEKIVTLLQSKDDHLRSIVASASQLSHAAKDVETSITLYLLLGHKDLKEKYFEHVANLQNAVESLDKTVEFPEGKKLLDLMC